MGAGPASPVSLCVGGEGCGGEDCGLSSSKSHCVSEQLIHFLCVTDFVCASILLRLIMRIAITRHRDSWSESLHPSCRYGKRGKRYHLKFCQSRSAGPLFGLVSSTAIGSRCCRKSAWEGRGIEECGLAVQWGRERSHARLAAGLQQNEQHQGRDGPESCRPRAPARHWAAQHSFQSLGLSSAPGIWLPSPHAK